MAKSIDEIVKEELNKAFRDRRKGICPINESGINRLLKHGENGMIIISGNRSDIVSSNPELSLENEYAKFLKEKGLHHTDEIAAKWLNARNKQCDKELKTIIAKSPYSYSTVYGGYHGQDGVKDDFEPSFVVYSKDKNGNTMPFNELLSFGLNLCKKFKQDSVYVQKPNEAPIYLNYKGEKVNSEESKNFKINRDAMFYTTTKRDKTNPKKLTADIVFENKDHKITENRVYCNTKPSSYAEKIARASNGEIFLDF